MFMSVPAFLPSCLRVNAVLLHDDATVASRVHKSSM
jgi:hypothetical protein